MKLSQLTKLIKEDKYNIYYYLRSKVPTNTPDNIIIKNYKPEYILQTDAVSPKQAKSYAPFKYFRDIKGYPLDRIRSKRWTLAQFYDRFLIIVKEPILEPIKQKPKDITLWDI